MSAVTTRASVCEPRLMVKALREAEALDGWR
jgi:hypothetical protein